MNNPSPRRARVPTLKALGAGLLLAWAATSASADSSASFSVTSFAYTVTGGQLSWSVADDYQTLASTAFNAGGLGAFDSHSDSPASGLANADVSSLTSHAGASASASLGRTIAGATSASTSVGEPIAQPNSADTQALQSGVFTLSAAGTVTFTTSYVLNVKSIGGNAVDEYGQARLFLTAGSYNNDSGGGIGTEHFSFDEATGIGTYSGVLTQTVSLAGPSDIGYYQLSGAAYSYAPAAAVPEPATTALMLVGLAGVAGLARSRRAATPPTERPLS